MPFPEQLVSAAPVLLATPGWYHGLLLSSSQRHIPALAYMGEIHMQS